MEGRAIRTTPATEISAALSSRYASVTAAANKYEEFLNVRWIWAIFLGIVEWGLLLVAELFLQLFLFGPIRGHRRRRQDPAGVELEDTLEIPIVEVR